MVVHNGLDLLYDFFSQTDALIPEVRPEDSVVRQWKAPTVGWLKLNVGVGFHEGLASYSFVVRDSTGIFLLAGARRLDGVSLVAHAKMMTL